MKRIFSFFTALAIALSLGVVPMTAGAVAPTAGDQYSIVIENTNDKHTYEAYQIFSADLSADGTILSNIKWGSGVSAAGQTAMKDAAKKAESLTDEAAAKAFAQEVDAYLEAAKAVTGTYSNGTYTISGLTSGYYLIKDKTIDGNAHESYTSYILQVVGNVKVSPKSGVPQSEKKVQDINDSTDTNKTGWQDSADYDINDQVPFLLKATLPSNVSSYKTYKIVFHDQLSDGLTYDSNARVMFDGQDVTNHFTVQYDDAKDTLTISCNDVKAFNAGDNAVITVEYTATLNDRAVIGAAGNPNKMTLEFSNNPNVGGEGSTGKTPEDKVTVFTYQLQVDKVNESNAPLKGAGFTLYKKSADGGDYRQVGNEVKGTDLTSFVWKGLDDGEYKLVETTVPDGYNKAEDLLFTITADHEVQSDDPKLKTLNGSNHISGDAATGVLKGTIMNRPGLKLPGTGGMGTTLFYTVGGAFVLVAGALLLVMKRKNSKG